MKEDETNFRFLIDGFPPDEDNLQGWINAMDGQSEIKHVLFFDCSTEVSLGLQVLGAPVFLFMVVSTLCIYTLKN